MNKQKSNNSKKVIIIGAGLSGCFMAICLAKKGYDVKVYDYRPDIRTNPFVQGQSVNMTIYLRGINALKKDPYLCRVIFNMS